MMLNNPYCVYIVFALFMLSIFDGKSIFKNLSLKSVIFTILLYCLQLSCFFLISYFASSINRGMLYCFAINTLMRFVFYFSKSKEKIIYRFKACSVHHFFYFEFFIIYRLWVELSFFLSIWMDFMFVFFVLILWCIIHNLSDHYFSDKFVKQYNNQFWRCTCILIIIQFGIYISDIIKYCIYQSEVIVFAQLFFVFIGMIVFSIYCYCASSFEQKCCLKIENRNFKDEGQSVLEIMQNAHKEIDELRILKHEILHDMILIRTNIENNQMDKALEMIQSIEGSTQETHHILAENPIVNSVLNVLENRCKKENIYLTLDVKVPSKFNIEDRDLNSLLFNVIDNAIHATTKISIYELKFIHFGMCKTNKCLFIECSNRCLEYGSNEKIIESGYGLKIIKHIVEKYNGTLNYGIKNNIYNIRILIHEN